MLAVGPGFGGRSVGFDRPLGDGARRTEGSWTRRRHLGLFWHRAWF